MRVVSGLIAALGDNARRIGYSSGVMGLLFAWVSMKVAIQTLAATLSRDTKKHEPNRPLKIPKV